MNIQQKEQPDLVMNLSKSVAITFSAQVFQFALSIGSGVLTARLLGPSGRGELALIVTAYSLATVIGALGLPAFNAYAAGKRIYPPRKLLSSSILVALALWGMLAVLFVGCYIARSLLPVSFNWPLLAIVVAIIPIGLSTQNFLGILQGLDRLDLYNLVSVASSILNVVLIVVLVLFLNLNLTGAVIAWIASLVIGLVISWLGCWRITQGSFINWDWNVAKAGLAYGIKYWLGQVVHTLNSNLSLFLIGFYLDTANVGYYAVAISLCNLLTYIPSSIGISVLPKMAASGREEAARITAMGLRYTLFFGLLAALGLGILSRFMVAILYTDAFLPALGPILILLPGYAIYGMAHVISGYFSAAIGKPLFASLVPAIALICSTVLMIVTIPAFGLQGAALSSSIGLWIAMAVGLTLFVKLSGVSIFEALILKPSDLRSLARFAGSFFSASRLSRHRTLNTPADDIKVI